MTKNKKRAWVVSGMVALMVVLALARISPEPHKPKHQRVALVTQPNTQETAQITEAAAYAILRQLKPNQQLLVELICDGKVATVFDKKASQQMLRDILSGLDSNPSTLQLDPTDSPDTAIVQGVQRFADQLRANPDRPLKFLMITQGTSDATVLQKIRDILKPLQPQIHDHARLYVIGLAPDRRLAFSKAFETMAPKVEFAGTSHDEWIQLIQKL